MISIFFIVLFKLLIMETYNNPQTSNVQNGNKPFSTINLILKIAGALAVVFLLFLPVAGCDYNGPMNMGEARNFTWKGWDIVKGFFNSGSVNFGMQTGTAMDTTMTLLFMLSMVCGLIILAFKKPIQFMIGGIAGLSTFLIAYFIAKNKYTGSQDGVTYGIQMEIGAYLALLCYAGIAITALIKQMSSNKNQAAPYYNAPPVYNPAQQNPVQQPVQQQFQSQQQYKAPPPPVQQMQQNAPKQKFCSKCGYKFPDNYTGNFCGKCGTKRMF